MLTDLSKSYFCEMRMLGSDSVLLISSKSLLFPPLQLLQMQLLLLLQEELCRNHRRNQEGKVCPADYNLF